MCPAVKIPGSNPDSDLSPGSDSNPGSNSNPGTWAQTRVLGLGLKSGYPSSGSYLLQVFHLYFLTSWIELKNFNAFKMLCVTFLYEGKCTRRFTILHLLVSLRSVPMWFRAAVKQLPYNVLDRLGWVPIWSSIMQFSRSSDSNVTLFQRVQSTRDIKECNLLSIIVTYILPGRFNFLFHETLFLCTW